MTNFTEIGNMDISDAQPPANLPNKTYPGVITKWSATDITNKEGKKIPKISIETRLTGLPEDDDGTLDASMVTKKKFTRDYLVDPGDKDSFYYLLQLFKSCGIVPKGGLGEYLPQLIGADVKVTLKERTYEDKNTGEMKARQDVSLIVGTHGG